MIDMYFFYNGKFYTYYNQLKRKEATTGLGESYLCFKESETDNFQSIFMDYKEVQ